MGLFGLSRDEVNEIAERHANDAKDNAIINAINHSDNSISNERKRICQLVAILLSSLPKAILNKKVSRDDIPYGEQIFPRSIFEENDSYDLKKLTIREILVKIDP